MNYKILTILFGGLIFFVLFFSVSANIKVNALNKQESIIPIIKTYIENEQYNDAIMFLKQVSSDNYIALNEQIMDFDYSLMLLTRKITDLKKGYFLKQKIIPLINKLEKIKVLKGKYKAYNYFCIGLIYKYLEEY